MLTVIAATIFIYTHFNSENVPINNLITTCHAKTSIFFRKGRFLKSFLLEGQYTILSTIGTCC